MVSGVDGRMIRRVTKRVPKYLRMETTLTGCSTTTLTNSETVIYHFRSWSVVVDEIMQEFRVSELPLEAGGVSSSWKQDSRFPFFAFVTSTQQPPDSELICAEGTTDLLGKFLKALEYVFQTQLEEFNTQYIMEHGNEVQLTLRGKIGAKVRKVGYVDPKTGLDHLHLVLYPKSGSQLIKKGGEKCLGGIVVIALNRSRILTVSAFRETVDKVIETGSSYLLHAKVAP